jgi:hypothetical protein
MYDLAIRNLKKIDILGPEPNLYTNSNSRHKTIFGGIMTIFTYFIICSLSTYFIYETFSRNTMSVGYNEVVDESPYYKFSDSPIIITLIDIKGNPIVDETVVSYEARYFNLDEKMTMNIALVKTSFCRYQFFKESNRDIYNSFPFLNYSICIDPIDFSRFQKEIFGVPFGLKPYSFYNYYVNTCINSTTSNITCKSEEYISQIMSNAYLMVSYSDYLIDSRNKGSPGLNFLNTLSFWITPTLSKWFILKIRAVTYSTDRGFVFENLVEDSYTHSEPVYESVDNRVGLAYPGNFITVTACNSSIKEYYLRSFQKFQNLLGNIGGVIKGIMVISIFIERYIARKLYLKHFVNDILHHYEGQGKI